MFERVVVYGKACCALWGEAAQAPHHGKKDTSAVFVGVLFVPEHGLCAVERLEVVAVVASYLHKHEGSNFGEGCRQHVVVLAVGVAHGEQRVQQPLCEACAACVCANDRIADTNGQDWVGEDLDALLEMEGEMHHGVQNNILHDCTKYTIDSFKPILEKHGYDQKSGHGGI